MRMTVATALSVLLAATVAVASTPPFGGDDTGFEPPTAEARVCASKVLRNAGRLVDCLARCHVNGVNRAFAGAPFADEICESACIVDYEQQAVKIVTRYDCPVCVDHTLLGSNLRDFFDQENGLVYCAGTVALSEPGGDDDPGFVPSSAAALRCQGIVEANVGRLARCVLKCHGKAGDKAFAGRAFDEEGCEDRCQVHLVTANLPGACPACINLPAIGGDVRDTLDANNGLVYCASPAGSFVD